MDDRLTINLIDEGVSAHGLNDENVVAKSDDETLTAKLHDDVLGANLQDSTLDVELAVGTFREKDYNKLDNKPQINGVTLQGNKTAEDFRLVPIVLSSFRAVSEPTKSFRQTANIFINNGTDGFRMTLQQVKDMNTKIVDVKDKADADFSKLDIGDYVYSEN